MQKLEKIKNKRIINHLKRQSATVNKLNKHTAANSTNIERDWTELDCSAKPGPVNEIVLQQH